MEDENKKVCFKMATVVDRDLSVVYELSVC